MGRGESSKSSGRKARRAKRIQKKTLERVLRDQHLANHQLRTARKGNQDLSVRLAREGKITTTTLAAVRQRTAVKAQRGGEAAGGILGVMTEDAAVAKDLGIGFAHIGLDEGAGMGEMDAAALLLGMARSGGVKGKGEGEEMMGVEGEDGDETEEEGEEEEEGGEEGDDNDEEEGGETARASQQQAALPLRLR